MSESTRLACASVMRLVAASSHCVASFMAVFWSVSFVLRWARVPSGSVKHAKKYGVAILFRSEAMDLLTTLLTTCTIVRNCFSLFLLWETRFFERQKISRGFESLRVRQFFFRVGKKDARLSV